MKHTHTFKSKFSAFLLASIAGQSVWAQPASADPRTLPLLQQSDMTYVGSFAVSAQTAGTSRFAYGGQAIAPYTDPKTGKHTLYMSGHIQKPGHVAQIEIPAKLSKSTNYAELPVAPMLQPFSSVLDNTSLSAKSGITSGDGGYVYGMMVVNEKLVLSAAEYYGCTQKSSHGTSNLDLAAGNDFNGFFRIDAPVNARTVGGPMMPVPAEWQTLVGGTALTGNWSIPVVSCNSAGPTITSFHPEKVGVDSVVKGNTLLYYPLGAGGVNRTLCVGEACLSAVPEATTNELYNLSTRYGGAAFPAGSRSVLFFGRHGTGPYCYGTPAECGGDPAEVDSKGPHAFPYRFQVWAYDMNELLKVKDGILKNYEPKPYAVWHIKDIDGFRTLGHAKIAGAGYDAATRRWYITTDYGEKPRVDVFEIAETSGTRTGGTGALESAPWKLTASRDAFGSALNLAVPGVSGQPVHYRVFDNQGRKLAEMDSRAQDGAAVWDSAAQPSGIYMVQAEVAGHSLVARLTLAAGRF